MRLSPVFSGADLEPAYLPLLRLWILRALVHCNGVTNFLSSRGFNDTVLPGFRASWGSARPTGTTTAPAKPAPS